MKRRQIFTYATIPAVSVMSGCIGTESRGENESGEPNSTDENGSDESTETNESTEPDARCMDDVHAVIVDESDIPDGAVVVDLSDEEFEHRSTVRRAIEDAVEASNKNGSVNICRDEYDELRETFERLSEDTDSGLEGNRTMYFSHEDIIAKVVVEANDVEAR